MIWNSTDELRFKQRNNYKNIHDESDSGYNSLSEGLSTMLFLHGTEKFLCCYDRKCLGKYKFMNYVFEVKRMDTRVILTPINEMRGICIIL